MEKRNCIQYVMRGIDDTTRLVFVYRWLSALISPGRLSVGRRDILSGYGCSVSTTNPWDGKLANEVRCRNASMADADPEQRISRGQKRQDRHKKVT